MMHYLITGSSYRTGKRVALDFVDKEQYKQAVDRLIAEFGNDLPVRMRSAYGKDISWESVVEYDPFFRNVEQIFSVDSFIELIKDDQILCGLDVAKYILSKVACTQIKLQKLTYMCYADYLCETKSRLFKDTIYAFQYGPVVKSILDRYHGQKDVETTVSEIVAKSRILSSKQGAKKLLSIDATLQKYGNLTAVELVDLTHKNHTPWSMTPKYEYSLIQDETILKYHSAE